MQKFSQLAKKLREIWVFLNWQKCQKKGIVLFVEGSAFFNVQNVHVCLIIMIDFYNWNFQAQSYTAQSGAEVVQTGQFVKREAFYSSGTFKK